MPQLVIAKVCYQNLRPKLESLKDCPKQIAELIPKGWSKEPKDRPEISSTLEFLAHLEKQENSKESFKFDFGSKDWLELESELANTLYPFIAKLRLQLVGFIEPPQWDAWTLQTIPIEGALRHLATVHSFPGLVTFRNTLINLNIPTALKAIKNNPSYSFAFE
jgi:hypothetical protein